MEAERFSRKERAVVLALVRNPEHSDTEISRSIGMNLYTFNKTKNSLIKRKMLAKYYVPNYGKIGFEILGVSYGSGIESVAGTGPMALERDEPEKTYPPYSVFGLVEGNNGVLFHTIKDYTNLKRALAYKDRIAGEAGLNTDSLGHTFFSFRDLHIRRFFDIQGLLEEGLGGMEIPFLEPKTAAQSAASRSWQDFFEDLDDGTGPDLETDRYRVLLEVVKEPNSKESDLIETLGMSRYKFRKIMDSLLDDRLIKPFYSTNVMGLGYSVMIFSHLRFKPGHKPLGLFERYEEDIPKNLMIMAFDHTDVVGLGIFRNLSEGSEAQMRMRKGMMDMGFLSKEPEVKIFSLPNCRSGFPLTFHTPLETKTISDPFKPENH